MITIDNISEYSKDYEEKLKQEYIFGNIVISKKQIVDWKEEYYLRNILDTQKNIDLHLKYCAEIGQKNFILIDNNKFDIKKLYFRNKYIIKVKLYLVLCKEIIYRGFTPYIDTYIYVSLSKFNPKLCNIVNINDKL